jgi:type IV fimbrial biogenesis protein FimT
MRVSQTQRQREWGFTLIEMMIVVAVFAIMAAIAIPSFMTLLPGMRLNGAARQVMGDLMAARMKAVKENNEFKVFFNSPGTNQYQILDDDDNDGTADTGEAITTPPKNIQDNYHDVTFTSTNNPIFSPRGTATSLPTITLQNSSGSKSVSVSIAGRVKID